MGAGRGGDYGNTPNKGGLVNNLLNLIEKYPLSDIGFFGTRGRKNRTEYRHISSDNPLETMRDFVSRAIIGAEIEPLENGHGFRARFSDGFELYVRESSASDQTPVIELWTKIKSRNAESIVEVTISKQHFKLRYQKNSFYPEQTI
ncbi:MAG: hypothetical protein IJ575_01035 [Selenomonadaceae bacterium]|nr:hypothetical protein [Selenomonadaceae bacterium]